MIHNIISKPKLSQSLHVEKLTVHMFDSKKEGEFTFIVQNCMSHLLVGINL